MSIPYVLRYIAEGEHQRQDFKLRVDDARKIARTLSAFANTDGGRLLIGVKDNGSVAGVRVDEEVHMLEAAATMYCRPRVSFHFQVWKVENKSVLEMTIDASDERPHLAEIEAGVWKAFIRRGDQNLPAPAVLREVWRLKDLELPSHYQHTPQEQKIFEALRTQDGCTVALLSRRSGIPHAELVPLLARLVRWGIVAWTFDNDRSLYRLT